MKAKINRKARLRVVDGRFQHVLERESAKAQECERPGAERRRHGSGQEAVAGHDGDAGLAEPVHGRRLAGETLPADGERLLVFDGIDEDRHFAADAVALRLQHVEGEAARDGGVDRVAALVEHPLSGPRCEVMAGCDDAVRAHVHGPRREWCWHGWVPGLSSSVTWYLSLVHRESPANK